MKEFTKNNYFKKTYFFNEAAEGTLFCLIYFRKIRVTASGDQICFFFIVNKKIKLE